MTSGIPQAFDGMLKKHAHICVQIIFHENSLQFLNYDQEGRTCTDEYYYNSCQEAREIYMYMIVRLGLDNVMTSRLQIRTAHLHISEDASERLLQVGHRDVLLLKLARDGRHARRRRRGGRCTLLLRERRRGRLLRPETALK